MVTYAPGPPTRAFESLVLLTQLCGGAFPIQGVAPPRKTVSGTVGGGKGQKLARFCDYNLSIQVGIYDLE